MTVSISQIWQDHLHVAPLPPWWLKMELKNISPVWRATGLKFWRILMFKVPEQLYWSRNTIGSFLSGITTSLVAKNGTTTPLMWLLAVAIDPWWIKSSPVDRFWCLRCLNDCLDMSITMGPKWVGLVWQVCLWRPSWIFKCPYLGCLKSYRAEIQNLS